MADILRSYLINLGFQVERGSERRFTETVGKTTARVAELGAAIEAAGTAVAAVVTKMSEKFEDLYYASQRIGSSVENIRGFSFALGQMGGSADGAQASLERIAEFMRSNPGGEGFIRALGVQTREANGDLRDTTEIVADLAGRFRNMPYFAAKARAGLLGIDDRTLQAMLRDQGQMRANIERQKQIYREAGVNQQAFAVQGRNFSNAVREVKMQMTALGEAVFMNLSTRVQPVLERFGAWVERNGPVIAQRLTGFLSGVWDMAVGIARIVTRAADYLVSLDHATHGLSTAFIGLLAAWRILNLGVLATPLGAAVGAVVALGLAIAGLVDDYEHWARGAASLFDWSGWKDTIDAAKGALEDLGDAFGGVAKDGAPKLANALPQLVGALADLAKSLVDVGSALEPLVGWLVRGFGPPAVHLLMAGVYTMTDAFESLSHAIREANALLHGDWATARQERLLSWEALQRRVDTDRSPAGAKPGAAGSNKPPVVVLHPEDRSLFQKIADWFANGSAPNPGMPSVMSGPNGPEFMRNGPPPGKAQMGAMAQQAMAYFQGQGWTRAQAAGLVANIQRESLFDPHRFGDNGQAYGIAQWHRPRQEAFARWAGHDLSASTYQEQLAFMQYELTRGLYQAAGRRLRSSSSAREAGAVVSSLYEQPADMRGEANARAGLASQFDVAAPQPAGAKVVNINNHTKIDVHGTGDARDTGRAVAGEQGRAHSDMIRSTKAVIQ